MAGEVKAIRKLLSGNGAIGIVTRLDRLEQNEGRRKVWIAAVAVAVIGLAVNALWSLVMNAG